MGNASGSTAPAGAVSIIDRTRQLDLLDAKRAAALPITVIGAGGIGNPTTLALAKMGFEKITVYDHDSVEAHNVPNQLLFGVMHVGKKKVDALAMEVERLAGIRITPRPEKYVDQPLRGIVIVAVDDMDVRRAIWEQCRERPAVRLFIEGRMGGEEYRVYAVRPCDDEHIRRWEAEWYPQSEGAELPCTARAIIYNTMAIGSDIAQLVKREAMAGTEKARPLPFLTMHDFVSGDYTSIP